LLVALLLAASPARAYIVGHAVSLEERTRGADLICKATVIADHPATDDWFEPMSGFEVRETELRVVSILKGPHSSMIRFRHYARSSGLGLYMPQSYTFVPGRTYLLAAVRASGDIYRQLSKSPAQMDGSVLLAGDAKPHRGTTLTDAEWAELVLLLKSPVEGEVVGAIQRLDAMSGGPAWDEFGYADFDRSKTLATIEPLVGSNRVAVATAAITVFGGESPYFEDQDAQFWLAGDAKGYFPGVYARKRIASPLAEAGTKALLRVATDGMTPEVRALAIRSLGRSSHALPAAMLALWLRDPNIVVRRAAVLMSAERPDREPIIAAAMDRSPDIRRAAALAVGFSQDPTLLPQLDRLLRESVPDVRAAAALSLESFPLDQAAPIMRANLSSEFRSVFINALAQENPQRYLAELTELMHQEPRAVIGGGSFSPHESWRILFNFIKARPPAELTAGKFDLSLDALERMHWSSSGEPTELYALYVSRGLVPRAKKFREMARKSTPFFDLDIYFDRVDRNPEAYLQQ
jgi:HEAT repeats